MTPETIERLRKKKPWKFCRKCGVDIKSTTGHCYDCWNGLNFTASPYGLVNANKDFKFTKSEDRMK